MIHPDNSPYYKIASLDHAPDIAKALADVMIAWSQAESVLLGLCQCLIGVDYTDCAIIFYSIPTFDGRNKLIKNLIKSGTVMKGDREPLLRALEGLRGLSGARNSYVHHSWAATGDGSETVTFNYLEPHDTIGRRRPIKAADLLTHAAAVQRRSIALGKEIREIFPQAPFDPPVSAPIPEHQRTPKESARLDQPSQA